MLVPARQGSKASAIAKVTLGETNPTPAPLPDLE